MWRLDGAAPREETAMSDLERLAAVLDERPEFFDRDAAIVVARAPGRLDLMGGIADYSGSLVLELPLAAATLVASQRADDGRATVRTVAAAADGADDELSVPMAALAPDGRPLDRARAHALLALDPLPRRRWAAYVLGVLPELARQSGVPMPDGLRLLVASTVPVGKGVSSSAALEVAAARAIGAVLGVELDGRELALLCQRVENLIVGAPCGVMDQMTAACGEANRLLALLCQPAELTGQVVLPPGLEVWGIDSGIRHAVTGADYGAVRVGAFMGYRIIAHLAGLPVAPAADGRVTVADGRWGGHLANIAPSEWETTFRDALPVELDGETFLTRYGGTTDAVTRVDPGRVYAVRQPTAHPIHEHHRVRLFRALLETGAAAREQRLLLGELMYQSHASYGACGLGSDGTDRLVELVRAAGPAAGLYGAKVTGGGSGGVVAVLARAGASDAVRDIARVYERESGRTAVVLGGSSSGAMAFGTATLRWGG